MTSVDESPEKNESRNTRIPDPIIQDSQDPWISEEELYTEGSSDEDDMALRMKRRAQGAHNKTKTSGAHHLRENKGEFVASGKTQSDTSVKECNSFEEASQADDSFKWRPTQGSMKFKETTEHIDSSSSKDLPPGKFQDSKSLT
ncbi:putative metalloreductase AIM14 [Frankliniella fusca]|uniref:Metalloreductase AIM14 n=1 Tax=Frankliniella fusca TaxID=407009 RepID=A0AAE1HB87_9NEOP|nr:putative metalloreductase AIM14 [Frankliniella fusca]